MNKKIILLLCFLCLAFVACNETNDKKYVELINDIDAITEVTLESGDLLTNLFTEYNKLSEEEKKLVTNYYLLEEYMVAYNELLQDKEDEENKDTFVFTISGPTEVEAESKATYSVVTDKNYEFEWSVSNPDIAEIDENGNLTPYEKGIIDVIATIKGTTNSQKLTVTIKQKTIYISTILLDGTDYLQVGESFELIVKTYPSNNNEEIKYEVDNDCVTIENGIVTAIKEGQAVIKVSTLDDRIYTTHKVTVSNIEVNMDVTLLNGVTREMTSYKYWADLVNNVDDVVLTLDQIVAKNNAGYAVAGAKLYDIVNSKTTISGSDVKSKISSYSVSSSYKINGSKQPSNYSALLTAATNKDAVPTTVTIKYGLINTFADLRSFPTNDIATTSNNFDRFQESGVEVGEGCLIYHESLDGNWYFIQIKNYFGWTEKKYITEVTQQEMKEYLTTDSFVVVTGLDTTIDNVKMRMGTRVAVKEVTATDYVLKMVGKDGFKEVSVSKTNNDIHYGYIDYTINNVLKQIFKLLGNAYSWGDDIFDGHDCSSTMNAVYHCMGFVMSRNTSSQCQMPYVLHDVQGYTDMAKKEILNDLQCGSLVFVSGHVMMYLGKVGNNYYIIHNFSSGGGCNISTTNLIRSGSTTYLTAFTHFLELK